MSDPEGILARWSRRKADARVAERDDHPGEPADASAEPSGPPSSEPSPTAAAEDQPFDSASLPPIDEINAGTDLRAFLDNNVPAEIRREALRRAWSTDPAIRDFVGLSENAWDFNAPSSIAGFGSLSVEDARRLVALISGEPAAEGAPAPAADVAPSGDNATASTEVAAGQGPSAIPGSPGHDEVAACSPTVPCEPAEAGASSEQPNAPRRPRRHGGALPRTDDS